MLSSPVTIRINSLRETPVKPRQEPQAIMGLWPATGLLTGLVLLFWWVSYVSEDSMNLLVTPLIAIVSAIIFYGTLRIAGATKRNLFILGLFVVVFGLMMAAIVQHRIWKNKGLAAQEHAQILADRAAAQQATSISDCQALNADDAWLTCIARTARSLEDVTVCRSQAKVKIAASPTFTHGDNWESNFWRHNYYACYAAESKMIGDAHACLKLTTDKEIVTANQGVYATNLVLKCLTTVKDLALVQGAAVCLEIPDENWRMNCLREGLYLFDSDGQILACQSLDKVTASQNKICTDLNLP